MASRRKSEELVAAGRVLVNGEQASIGQSVDPTHDVIEVDGRPIAGTRQQRVYLVMVKPSGVTSTVSDRHAKRTVIDLVPKNPTPLLTRLVLHVDPKDYVVRQAVLYDQFQNTVTMTFNKVTINPSLADSLFVFTPPPGAAVVPLDPR